LLLLALSLVFIIIFINGSYDGLRCLLWLVDLDEGVLMADAFLTSLAEVEVLANAALVANA